MPMPSSATEMASVSSLSNPALISDTPARLAAMNGVAHDVSQRLAHAHPVEVASRGGRRRAVQRQCNLASLGLRLPALHLYGKQLGDRSGLEGEPQFPGICLRQRVQIADEAAQPVDLLDDVIGRALGVCSPSRSPVASSWMTLSGVFSSWETSFTSRLRRSRCVSRAEVIRLKAALILPSSSEEVTGSRVVSPWAIAWVASVRAATGAVIRLDTQAASRMATPAVSAPPMRVMYRSALRNPCDSAR